MKVKIKEIDELAIMFGHNQRGCIAENLFDYAMNALRDHREDELAAYEDDDGIPAGGNFVSIGDFYIKISFGSRGFFIEGDVIEMRHPELIFQTPDGGYIQGRENLLKEVEGIITSLSKKNEGEYSLPVYKEFYEWIKKHS